MPRPRLSRAEVRERLRPDGLAWAFDMMRHEEQEVVRTRAASPPWHISETGAGTIVGGDLGCLLNIEGRLRRNGDHSTRVLHVAEVLSGLDPQE